MVKRVLKFTTACLFFGALVLSISTNSHGRISFVKQAKADGGAYQVYGATCPDGVTQIIVCGEGGNNCTPSGKCPPPP